MQLQTCEGTAARAALELFNRIVFERTETAERDQPIGKGRDLLRRPVVFCLHLWESLRPAPDGIEVIRVGQHDRSGDSGGIEHGDQLFGADRFLFADGLSSSARRNRVHELAGGGTEEMLMVIDPWDG